MDCLLLYFFLKKLIWTAELFYTVQLIPKPVHPIHNLLHRVLVGILGSLRTANRSQRIRVE